MLFRRAVSRLPLRVEYPDGTVLGLDAHTEPLPRMILRDPDAFFARVGSLGLIGFGESYTAAEWTSPDPAAVLTVLAARLTELVPAGLQSLRSFLLPSPPTSQDGTAANARTNIEHHYDLSNELFQLFLDETMTYSSALFEDPATASWPLLADAQRYKIDRLLDAAGVRAGTRVLEIGSGWGELCVRAAARGATVHSVTLSNRQLELARIRVAAAGFADSVVLELCDYRDVRGEYDAIVSVEMIEAVGYRYWPTYFDVLAQRLAPGGRVALQAITMPHDRMLASRDTYTWIQKYIFPGGSLPSTRAITTTAHRAGLRVRENSCFGEHYATTLRLWRERFDAHAAEVAALGFDATFRRLWQFYLAYSEAGFRSGYLDVQQIVLHRPEEQS
ncbi:methyltransferase domain-containing protein [Nocardia yunnanensis]|uniref:Methyltransferase domain-containing protein n=2 Tax=Nocardia yunnanensis TaxID=2382165 RepID=A0A386ZN50_9NOCA|nr:methyltransferase domain-containing protein [Nocardia yunnanensis]